MRRARWIQIRHDLLPQDVQGLAIAEHTREPPQDPHSAGRAPQLRAQIVHSRLPYGPRRPLDGFSVQTHGGRTRRERHRSGVNYGVGALTV
jgi:hypothetical protein